MADVFRKVSLERLSSPDQLDKLITVTSPRGWLTVITIGIVLACIVIWGVFGSIPKKVETSGILISSGGVHNIVSTVGGEISDLRLKNGDLVQKGDTIAIIGEDKIVQQINKTTELLSILEGLSPRTNWQSVTIPLELLEFQQMGLQIQSSGNSAGYAATSPEIAKKDYENYLTLYESGAVSKAELDAKYNAYQNAKSNYSQQSLSASQAVAQFNAKKEAKISEYQTTIADLIKSVETEYRIIAPSDGKITSIKVSKGDLVGQGTAIASIAKTGSNVKALEAVIYVHVADGKKIREGMEVKIYPTTVMREEYGYMVGTVVDVPEYPVSKETVMTTLGNEGLVQVLTGQGAPLEVRVDLVADENTVSGYAWSSKKGGTVSVQNGTICSAAFVVETQRPIAMVIPILKQKYLPIE